MAVEYPGNVIPSPGMWKGGQSVDDELLYSTVGFTQKGVTLKAGQGVLTLGTVLGRVTATKKYVAYSNAATDGSEVARGVLRTSVVTGTDAQGKEFQGNIVIQGILKNAKIVGADAAALTDLNARQDTVLDTFTF